MEVRRRCRNGGNPTRGRGHLLRSQRIAGDKATDEGEEQQGEQQSKTDKPLNHGILAFPRALSCAL